MWTSLLPLLLNQNFHNLLSCFIKALKIIRPDSCLFFYSDADPKDPELEYAVLQIAAQKNVHIAFLIKGTCNTGIPFLARLENSTKATCLKQSLDKGSFSNFVIFYHKIFYKFMFCLYYFPDISDRRKRSTDQDIHQPWNKLYSFDKVWVRHYAWSSLELSVLANFAIYFCDLNYTRYM